MRIALSEQFPILETALRESMAHLPHRHRPVLDGKSLAPCDLVLWDRNYFSAAIAPRAEVYLIPGGIRIEEEPLSGILLAGGMNRADPVTLSSIGEDRAMLCLQQEICFSGQNIAPFERPIFFDRRLNLYKNIAIGFALTLTEYLFGEVEKCK